MKKENIQCDFGQYMELWKNHNAFCKKIIRITSNYIVYIDKSNNIDWETTEKYDSEKESNERINCERLLGRCLIAECKPTGGLSEESILSFKTIVGEAIVNCLERNLDGSEEILKAADEFRIDRVIEKSREWYLAYTTMLTAIMVGIAILIDATRLPVLEEWLPCINIGSWAIAGACLSIILRSGNIQNASYAGKWLHFVESGCRLIGGFITGQIVYLGIKSGILFSNIAASNNSQYTIFLLALLAGASERFAPSIITKIVGQYSETKAAKEN